MLSSEGPADFESALGDQELKDFRLGFDNLTGLGFHLQMGSSVGFLLGGGLHWSLSFFYNDLFYGRDGDEPSLYFDLGLGGAADFYIMASDVVTLYFGGTSFWDFLTLHGNSYLNQNWDKDTRWGYGFNAGFGFKF